MIDNYLVQRWDIYRWYRIFRELSMESIESQLPNIGLEALPNVPAVRGVAHHFLEQYQIRQRGKIEDEALMRETFGQIAQVTSEETAEALYQWGVKAFHWEITRWHAIFSLLSMERVEPFLPAMGLNLPNVLAVYTVARHFLEQYQERTGDETEDKTLTDQTFARLAQATSEETAEDLYRWGLQQFPQGGSDIAREFAWAHLLRELADAIEGKGNGLAPLALPDDKAHAIVEIIRAYVSDEDAWEDRIEAVESQPKSDWEQRVYQEYAIENIPEISPLDMVEEAIDFQLFHKTWGRIKLLFTAEEIEKLLQWGRLQAEREAMPIGLAEFPPNPGIS